MGCVCRGARFWFIDHAKQACSDPNHAVILWNAWFDFTAQAPGCCTVVACSWSWCPSLPPAPALTGEMAELCLNYLCAFTLLLSFLLTVLGSIYCRPSLHVYCPLFKWKLNLKFPGVFFAGLWLPPEAETKSVSWKGLLVLLKRTVQNTLLSVRRRTGTFSFSLWLPVNAFNLFANKLLHHDISSFPNFLSDKCYR